MTGRLEGKRALVYGGGSGLGLACTEGLLKEGALVAISGRSEERLATAAARLGPLGSVFRAAGDATVEADVARITAAVVTELGGLDTLVVAAGTSAVGSVLNTSLNDFRVVAEANLLPVFLATRCAAPYLENTANASIIAISSMYGLVGQRNRVAYCTSKAGVIGMVRAMGLDFAESGVRVNAVCPGFIETELALEIARQDPDPVGVLERRRKMHPIPRSGRPEEVAAMVVYLASDDAGWVTGQSFAIDGGYTIR